MSKEVLQSIIKTPEEKAQTKEAIAANKERAHTRRREAIIGEYIKTPKDKLLMAVAKFVGIPVDNLFEKLTDANKKDIQLRWDKRRAERKAIHGDLTGLINRRGLYEYLDKLQRALQFHEDAKDSPEAEEREPQYFSVIKFDLDDFKNINDTYDHLKGDKLLQLVADVMRNKVRTYDLPARDGGDEFVIVVKEDTPNSCDNAIKIAKRVHKGIEELKLSDITDKQEDKDKPVITASMGIATYSKNIDSTMEHADKSLYFAKGIVQDDTLKVEGDIPKGDDAKNQIYWLDSESNTYKKVEQ